MQDKGLSVQSPRQPKKRRLAVPVGFSMTVSYLENC